MNQALATIGGTASNAGFGMQEMSTAIGLLTNKGFSAAQASQDLNHAILLMQAPSKGGTKVMKELGLSFTDAKGNMKPFPTILNEIGKSMDGMTSSEKTKALKTMFGTSGMAAVLPLLDSMKDKSGSTAKSWDAFSKSLNSASKNGATATKYLNDQAAEMQKNVGSKIEQIGGNWEAFSNKSMAAKSTVTGGMLDMINKTMEWATESNSGIAKVARGFMGLSPVIGPAMTAIGGFTRNLGPIVSTASKIGSGLLNLGKNATGAVSHLSGFGKTATTAADGATKVGTASGSSAKEMIAMGLAAMEIGAAIAIASAGIALLVMSITKLAATGTSGVVALTAVTVAVGALAGIFALLGPRLTASAVGIAAFGVAVLAAGAGIALATAGVALLVTAITNLASTGKAGVVTVTAITIAIAALAAVFAMLGPALTASVVGIVGFGVAIAAIGVGIGAAAAGMALLVQAFIQLTTVSAQIVPTLTAIGTGISAMFTQLLQGAITNAPIIVQTISVMMQSLLQAVITNAPLVAKAFLAMLQAALQAITTAIPEIAAAGLELITSFLSQIRDHIGEMTGLALQIVTNFLNGVASKIGGVVASAADLIAKFLSSLASHVGEIVKPAVQLIANFINAIANNLGKIIDAGANLIVKFLNGIASKIGDIVNAAMNIVDSLVKGILKVQQRLFNAAITLINGFAQNIEQGAPKLKAAGGRLLHAIIAALPGGGLINAGINLIAGFVNGIRSMVGQVVSAAENIGRKAVGAVKSFLHIGSPSKVMRDQVGKWIPAGMAVGMEQNADVVSKAAGALSTAAIPDIPKNQIAGAIQQANGQLQQGLSASVAGNITVGKQPANIRLNIGGHDYKAFVDDISTQQDKTTNLRLSF